MVNDFQRTLATTARCAGVGLHTGLEVVMRIEPALPGHGIVFIRDDLERDNAVPALFDRVVATSLCTKIANDEGGASVSTVEHLMAALWGCGIDNACIRLNGHEVPIMDGSADHFVQIIKQAGIEQQDVKRKVVEVLTKVQVGSDDKYISIEPSDVFELSFEIDFANQYIHEQRCDFTETESFATSIAKARTFGFFRDLEYLRSQGFALGASLANAVAIGEDGIMNSDGLRYDDEFVRHKILDCIGDLYLAGVRIKGKIKAVQSGHQLNNMLLRKLFASDKSFILK